jgi:hypothetical protein
MSNPCRVALLASAAVLGCGGAQSAEPGDATTSASETTGGAGGTTSDTTGSTGSTAAGDSSSSGDDELPSPYSDGTTGTTDAPTATSEEVLAAITSGLGAFLRADPQAIALASASMLVFDADCPEEQTVVDGEFVDVLTWNGQGCTTADGLTFEGAGRLETTTAMPDGDRLVDAVIVSSEGGVLQITADDGRTFQLSGYLEARRAVGSEASEGLFTLIGDVMADPDTAAGHPVLTGELRPQGYLYAFEAGEYRGIGGSGSISGAALGDAGALSFADVLIANAPCADEPAGDVSVRDDAGFWHDVVFDAATFDGESYDWSGSCDGCGTHVAGGEIAGDACMDPADLAALLDWEVFPW